MSRFTLETSRTGANGSAVLMVTVADGTAGTKSEPIEVTRAGLPAAAARLAVMMPGTATADVQQKLQREIDLLGPVVTCLADVERKDIDWLWTQKFARSKVSVLFGDPGLGKSGVTVDIAARISTGSPWPDGSKGITPSPVIFFTAEDDLADTLGPRLDAAGADSSKIFAVEAIRTPGADGAVIERSFTLDDMGHLYDVAEEVKPAAIFIDPVTAYCGKTDTHKNAEVRSLLAPLTKLAAAHNIAIILVTHMSKGGGSGPALYRATGSLAFVAAARSAWLVARDKENPQRRLFLPAKNNIGKDSTGLAYTIADCGGLPVIQWERGVVTIGADEALSEDDRNKPGPESDERDAATDWLTALLAGGALEVGKIKEEAGAAGMAWRTVHRAKDALGVQPFRNQFGGAWSWVLPPPKSERQPISHDPFSNDPQ